MHVQTVCAVLVCAIVSRLSSNLYNQGPGTSTLNTTLILVYVFEVWNSGRAVIRQCDLKLTQTHQYNLHMFTHHRRTEDET